MSTYNHNYDELSDTYDLLTTHGPAYEKNLKDTNNWLERVLFDNGVKTVLDATCGTGLQSRYLAERGYHVTANDISERMINVCRSKTAHLSNIRYSVADIRTLPENQSYDAIISMFNSLSHMPKQDFVKVLRKFRALLNTDGLLIFDIFNFDQLKHIEYVGYWFIGAMHHVGPRRVVQLYKNEINYQTEEITTHIHTLDQYKDEKPKEVKTSAVRISFTQPELEELLRQAGFQVLRTTAQNGRKLNGITSPTMALTAKKMYR